METYLTEEERLEALGRWWKANKSSASWGVILGLMVVLGWKLWQGHLHERAMQASTTYLQFVDAVKGNQDEAALKLSERLVDQYGSTTYADYARLMTARIKVKAGDLDAAAKSLEAELKEGKDEAVKPVARLRLGRIYLAKGDHEAALKLVDPNLIKTSGSFQALLEEVRGDSLLALKRPVEARAAYAAAKSLGNPSPLLELKLNDLPQGG
jgi:predicted negative regulator of RcsB-dependent stress response